MALPLHSWLKDFSGMAGICVDLGDGRILSHNPEARLPAASLIKLPIFLCYLEACQAGRLSPREPIVLETTDIVGGCGSLQHASPGSQWPLETLAEWMLTRSDNTAANILIDRLGMGSINAWIQALGLNATRLERKLMDATARASGRENWTSPHDLLRLFQCLRDPPDALWPAAAVTLSVLKRQTIDHKLPHYLPKGTVVAHKTGELAGSEHDAGIIYRRGAAAIAVVMSAGLAAPAPGVALCRRVGVWVYDRMVFSV